MTTTLEPSNSVDELAGMLSEARERTLMLIEPVAAADLTAQHDPLMSPIIWDLGHIARFEELWLLRNTLGAITAGEMPGLYDPFANPRASRGDLPLPSLPETLRLMRDVRERVISRLPALDFPTSEDPLLRDGYVGRMVAQHEYQHNETILQTLQLKCGAPYSAPRHFAIPSPPARDFPRGMVRIESGEYPVGTDDRRWAYDNERSLNHRHLSGYEIDSTPVTNGDYLHFMNDGGYTDASFWSGDGWKWLRGGEINSPAYWEGSAAEGWRVRTMDHTREVPLGHPVCHVSYYEADAFARWAGKRLPNEAEWEVAATWDSASGGARLYPWGDEAAGPDLANIDQLTFGTAPLGAYQKNASPAGCYGMIGDVWEWTSSEFSPYPGYTTFPYKEYSELFFGGEYKVLRGGSWATRSNTARTTFRNWDYPIRRQIFAGFRCARDV